MAGHEFRAVNGSYEHRAGNEVDILIDGEKAYKEISDCFHSAKKFIYLTISYGGQNFLLVPGNLEAFFFDILRSRQQAGVDVRMVVWQPALKTDDTIPDPAPVKIPGAMKDLEVFKPDGIMPRATMVLIDHRWGKLSHAICFFHLN